MSLIFNGTTVEKVYFNGVEVTSLYHNGAQVFSKPTGGDPPAPSNFKCTNCNGNIVYESNGRYRCQSCGKTYSAPATSRCPFCSSASVSTNYMGQNGLYFCNSCSKTWR